MLISVDILIYRFLGNTKTIFITASLLWFSPFSSNFSANFRYVCRYIDQFFPKKLAMTSDEFIPLHKLYKSKRFQKFISLLVLASNFYPNSWFLRLHLASLAHLCSRLAAPLAANSIDILCLPLLCPVPFSPFYQSPLSLSLSCWLGSFLSIPSYSTTNYFYASSILLLYRDSY